MILKKFQALIRFPRDIKVCVPIFILTCLTACVTQSKVEYMQAKDDKMVFDEADFPDYKLKPNDELYIQINSLDEGAANVFSNSSNQAFINTGGLTPYGASLISYSIDKNGNLLLPVIGSISASGKTLAQLSFILRDSLKHILNEPVVSVKLVNRYVTIVGEVNSPGHFPYSQEKLTIYDALGLAGDITDYGDRNKVVLVRNEDAKNIRINLNLTRSDIFASDYYNLRPNDIIYVKPLRNKFWGMRQFPFAVLFSTITTGLLIYNIFK